MTASKGSSGAKISRVVPLDVNALSMLTATFEAIGDAMVLVDQDGRIVRCNAAFRALMGMAAEDPLLSAPLAEHMRAVRLTDAEGQPLPEAQWPQVRVLRGETLRSEQETDVRLTTLDGRAVWLRPSGNPLLDDHGRVVGDVVAYRDVTARHQTEAALAESTRQQAQDAQELTRHVAELEGIFASITAAVVVFDAEGRITR